MDHPDRCLAYDAVSQEYMSRVFMIPFHWDLIKRWAVQSWVKGFQTHLYGMSRSTTCTSKRTRDRLNKSVDYGMVT